MATLADINTKITNLLGVDTNTYPNASRVIDLNLWNQKIVSMILDSQDESSFDDENYTTYPREVFSLVAGQRDYFISQSYNILKVKDLSVTYDGVNWHQARPLDTTESTLPDAPAAAAAQNLVIDSYYSKNDPRYSYKYGALFLYPAATAADVSAGAAGMAEFFRSPYEYTLLDLTTGTLIPGFDISFHMMLAYGAAFEYAQAQRHPSASDIYHELQTYEERLRKQYSSKQLDRRYVVSAAVERYK